MKYTLGIDVGGTKIAAGLVDSNHKVSKVIIIPTSQTDLLGQLENLITSYTGFEAIGLGLPGLVKPNGEVVRLPNILKFKHKNLRKYLNNKFKVPVNVVNDAKAFALAEALIGSGKKVKTLAGVILGTGIGVGLVSNKKIYFGRNILAGEIGGVEMPDGRTLEQQVKSSGPFKNAKQAHKYLRSLVSFIVQSVDPDMIVVGGGWSTLPGMQQEFNQILRTLKKHAIKTKVLISKLKHAGIIGAVLALKAER